MNRTRVYKIVKEYTFAAAHQIRGLPDGHKCSRLHGHSYKVVVAVSCAGLDEVGFVVDFGDLNELVSPLVDVLDHSNLNELEVLGGVNPTSENLCKWFFENLIRRIDAAFNMQSDASDWVRLEYVRVHESDTSYAELGVRS